MKELNQLEGEGVCTRDSILLPSATRLGHGSLIAKQIGDYTVLRRLGQGGHASVYLSMNNYLRTWVALKLLDDFLASEEDVRRFHLEVYLLWHLQHRHIVRMLDFNISRDMPFLAMGYAPLGDLGQHFPKGSVFSVHAIMPVVLQVASALQYIHNAQLIHCDVKPSNILLATKQEAWLSDFGIAHVMPAGRRKPLDVANKLIGTPLYLSPERIEGSPVPASDQYSLAMMVYCWLCGAEPFSGTGLQICLQHMSTPPPCLRDFVPSISLAVERVVLKALAKDPKQRFSHVGEFAHALKEASLAERGSGAPRDIVPLRQAPSITFNRAGHGKQYKTSAANTG
ncbi:MAG TPA: serine/threonine-protein kinase [Ktedonobacteraceae bacterium]|jgi:serine/threonine protein kinase|nr:serine/threonine-protein kinase [Ktedonobacteraceae bacterium]